MNCEIRPIDNIKGKGVFASKNIASGSVIFEEDPLVCCQFSWNAAYRYKACDHCLRPLETAQENARRLTGQPNLILPYSECCTTKKDAITVCESCKIQYCSEECRLNAYNQYHRLLCPQSSDRSRAKSLEQLNEAWKQMHYPPETSTIMIIPRILATIIQSANSEEMNAIFTQFCHQTISSNAEFAHKLLGVNFADQIRLLHGLLLQSVPPEGVEHLLTEEGFQALLALIGTNGQGVGTSAISQWVARSSDAVADGERAQLDAFIDKLYEDMEGVAGHFLNNEGVALYRLQSGCNHSCAANAECNFRHNNSRVSVVALKEIAAGEEICISYLDECDLSRSRHSRQKMLRENYLFTCNCPRCEEQGGDDDVTSEEEEGEEECMSD